MNIYPSTTTRAFELFLNCSKKSSVDFLLPLAVTKLHPGFILAPITWCHVALNLPVPLTGLPPSLLKQPMALAAVATCLLSEHQRDRLGQEDRKCSYLPHSVLYGEPSGTGTEVSPAPQVVTFINSDTNVQNCQAQST